MGLVKFLSVNCSSTAMRLSILVIAITILMLAIVSPVQSCHRKVEYHHFYKKHPTKGHGHGWGWGNGGYGGGHGGHHGGGYGGHKGGYGHGGGHGKGHHKGYEEKGYGGGHGGHEKGYGGGHGGHEKGYGGGHGGHEKGYGGGHGGHEKGYGGGHGGHEKGYGVGHGGHEKGYGGGHGGHQMGYGGGGHKGGGHGHQMGYGGHGGGHAHGYGDSGHHGQSYMHNPHHKGMKYKHSSYEMVTYGDKGGHAHKGGTHGHGGYNNAHHTQKGYGYSGPYPNTEYSSPVVAAVNPPETGVAEDGSTSLDVADAANYIRNYKDSNQQDSGQAPLYLSTPVLEDTVSVSSSDNSQSHIQQPSNTEGDISLGNFDLNLDFNGELPSPFRRSGTAETTMRIPRKRKKISSTFKASTDELKSLNLPSNSDDSKNENGFNF